MTKTYPKIRFSISKAKELNTYLAFLNEGKCRDNSREMNWAFYRSHPQLRILKNIDLSLDQKIRIIKNYIDNFYIKNIRKIEDNLNKEENNWRKIEGKFYRLIDDIFDGHKWPKGKYIAYATIWSMYPRFLKDKTFQIPSKRIKQNFTQVVIAHEMLHFMFYDYVYKKFPKLKDHRYDLKLWNISEAFNVVIQNSPDWLNVFKQKTMGYPEHKDLVKKLKKIWKGVDGDITRFVVRLFQWQR